MTATKAMFPRWLRVWHWTNAAFFLVLMATGFSLHFAGVAADMGFRWSVQIHNAVGVGLIGAYLYYLVAMAVTGHWRQFVPPRDFLQRTLVQMRYYAIGIFKGAHHPYEATVEHRFNPMQQAAYLSTVLVLFPGQIVTGIALLYPGRAPERVAGMGGVWPMAIAHSVLAYAFAGFLCVHIYLALTVAEPHTGIRAMVYGDRPGGPAPHGDGHDRHETHGAE